jgi:hypothetical protein
MQNLKNVDIIIEAHDFIDLSISDHLENLLSATHRVVRIKSTDDIEKARRYDFPQTNDLPLAIRKSIFAEGRPHIMEWLIAYSV